MRVKSEERRQAIVDIAKEEFLNVGFGQTSMSAIARKVGGSKATLYNYFRSKEEIFNAVMESVAGEISLAFEGLSTKEDIRSSLLKFGIHYLKSICSPELVLITKLAFVEAERSELGRYYFENGPKTGLRIMEQFLIHYAQNGEIKCNDCALAAIQLKALVDAELKEPYALGVIAMPDKATIEVAVERAVDSFLKIYRV